ncbi:hypothetical protein [Streptomyces sp. NPDC056190]|uniref:hypothetical protein n=1 Tax=unclassified Streptomyces TaxID=2593676 RepID=UPI0035E203DA
MNSLEPVTLGWLLCGTMMSEGAHQVAALLQLQRPTLWYGVNAVYGVMVMHDQTNDPLLGDLLGSFQRDFPLDAADLASNQ